MNNVITDFLTEAVKRFLSKNPKFFKVINVILTITIVVTGLPNFIAQFGFENQFITFSQKSRIIRCYRKFFLRNHRFF